MGPAVAGRPPGVPEWRLNLISSDPPSLPRMILDDSHHMTLAAALAVFVLLQRRMARSLATTRPSAISTTSRLFSETSQTAPAARSEKYVALLPSIRHEFCQLEWRIGLGVFDNEGDGRGRRRSQLQGFSPTQVKRHLQRVQKNIFALSPSIRREFGLSEWRICFCRLVNFTLLLFQVEAQMW